MEKEKDNQTCAEKKVKRSGLLNEFLWLCSGANRKILRQCPTDHAKYAGIGGTILCTAILASLSGGYAIYKVFANEVFNPEIGAYETDVRAIYIAVAIGIFWGITIFNLDRFMVNTMYSDGTHKIIKEEWQGALPRLILAVFIGVVISTPIELRIFRDKIQAQLVIAQGEERQKMDNAHQNLRDEIKRLEDQKRENATQLENKRAELSVAEDNRNNETQGKGKTGKIGYGPAAKQLEEKVGRITREVNELEANTKKDNEAIDARLEKKYEELNAYSIIDAKAEKSVRGFAAELKALNTITNPKKDMALFIARLLIMFLFVAIEIIPTLFKLMLINGPYDDILEAEKYKTKVQMELEKHQAKVMSDKRISDINDEINTEVQISTEKNRNRLEAEIQANKKVMEQIALAQAELLETAINEWREKELKKIKENPSNYIKSNISTDA